MAYTMYLNPAWAFELGIKEISHTWYIQDRKPQIIDFYGRGNEHLWRMGVQVDLLQADGEELAMINLKFENLPTANKDIVTWRGDMASFIFNNL